MQVQSLAKSMELCEQEKNSRPRDPITHIYPVTQVPQPLVSSEV